ncbi:glycosyltransferase family 117 protein [Pedobacter duraquae]|uniref:Uncharacterized protein DUF2723 n=1 Tax=Pedobacter duraquae TaxID=425511 RepID=A0A4R6IS29_9SPHI|nr:DUF2723 domain-containing protein [Pedobacter duraquae]TDO24766.1 uncharacterized protein DUF2723 [Pedobacter duraquae]
MKQYLRINNLVGFFVFVIAVVSYWRTMEPTVSFWDCGEFISAAYKLEVGHQPGAPLFLMIGKLFSLMALGNTAGVAYWVNFSAVLASAATVMFLFWTITALALRIYVHQLNGKTIAGIIAAGVVGALAFAYSDTFWFSAVESEVYALSSLFTAVTFWAILKWERELDNRWLVFIAYLIGLSIGVHLLSLLAIPAVVLVYYFKTTANTTLSGTIKALFIGSALVGLVQFVIIQYVVLFAAKADLFFTNTMHFSMGIGAFLFLGILVAAIAYGIHYAIKRNMFRLNLALTCLTCVLFGFSSYFLILIRANAKPTINLSNPDNAFGLYNYLGRTNYEGAPLLYGNTFDAKQISIKETGTNYKKDNDKYVETGKNYSSVYDKNMLFPRLYSTKPAHVSFYKQWLNLGETAGPSFLQNLEFFTSYQMGFMYWRYFLWNFAGRQDDVQGTGDQKNGNWITGIRPLDQLRLGKQSALPLSIAANEGNHTFYGLPLILGIAGLLFLYRKQRKEFLVISVLFFCTGLAIIIVLNQDPLQVRERDYAYPGSFYAFAICIGFGVLALKELLSRYTNATAGLVAASVFALFAGPVLMGSKGWADHDRSAKTTALTWAKNYLNSCAKDAILFTNADNDTYPLWYAQEVEGIRTDVRVICLQFLADADFINQMKKQSYLSAPLPITMHQNTYKTGTRDYMPYVDYGLTDSVELSDILAVLTSDNKADQVEMNDGSFSNFLPAHKFKMTIDKDLILKTGTLKATEKGQIADVMEWEFGKTYAGKSDLTMFDILVHNNWKRPVYFATSVSQDTYLGLDKYLYLEGYAYRLLPLKPVEGEKTEHTHSSVMYNNMVSKMDFSDFKKTAYLDPESRRVLESTWNLTNTLAANLHASGNSQAAANLLIKSVKELPLRNYGISDTLNRIYTVENLYQNKQHAAAKALAADTARFIDQELNYIVSLDPIRKSKYLNEVRIGMYVLNGLDQITAAYKDDALNASIKSRFNNYKALL